MLASFYNIHTHTSTDTDDTLSVVNLYKDFDRIGSGGSFSIGLHPWYLQDHEKDFAAIKKLSTNKDVIVIGECGLDRISTTAWDVQLSVFRQQILLANDCGKPLIIHCVKAFDELIIELDKSGIAMPVIIHGYNKKQQVADKLLAKGYYLSFGAALLNESFPAGQVLAGIPADRFFLETDDSEVAIKDIYEIAAKIRKTSIDSIILQVQENFKTVFKR